MPAGGTNLPPVPQTNCVARLRCGRNPFASLQFCPRSWSKTSPDRASPQGGRFRREDRPAAGARHSPHISIAVSFDQATILAGFRKRCGNLWCKACNISAAFSMCASRRGRRLCTSANAVRCRFHRKISPADTIASSSGQWWSPAVWLFPQRCGFTVGSPLHCQVCWFCTRTVHCDTPRAVLQTVTSGMISHPAGRLVLWPRSQTGCAWRSPGQ